MKTMPWRREFIKRSAALSAAAMAPLSADAGVERGVAPPLYDDFSDPAWPSPRWAKFTVPQFDMWDPQTKVTISGGADGTLTIDLPRFSTSHPAHVKAVLLSTRSFDIQESAGLTVRADMSVTTFGTAGNPFGLEPGDVRLAAGSLMVFDPETGIVLDFFVSNDRIRPLYERLPRFRGEFGDYPAYSILGESMPTKAGEWHSYEVRYDRGSDLAEWWVDGKLLARQRNVGAPPGEQGPIVKLRRPRVGGGLFTLLDDLNNDLRRAGDQAKIPGVIPSNLEDRFGQGGRASFRRFAAGS